MAKFKITNNRRESLSGGEYVNRKQEREREKREAEQEQGSLF